jgi:hypothetical protein
VLERLREFGLYHIGVKCQFGVTEVGFLGIVNSPDQIGMVSDSISTIKDWRTPESVLEVQVLLRITNFYRRFIRKYVMVTTPISELLKKVETSRTPKHLKWEWTRDAELVFRKFTRAFTDAPILTYVDQAKPIVLQSNASSFAIAGILNLYKSFGILKPVNFYSRKCTGAE